MDKSEMRSGSALLHTMYIVSKSVGEYDCIGRSRYGNAPYDQKA